MSPSVIVVEDEKKLSDLLRSYLERESLDVRTTGSGAEALQIARDTKPDLVILDLGLPDIRGEDVAVGLREFSDVPIMMLTARSSDADRIHGLELGADDYVTKPFSPREVVLRTQAILRRGRGPQAAATMSFGNGSLVIDIDRREAVLRGTIIDLTPTEWGLLTALSAIPGRVYSRHELINRVRSGEFEGYERTIDSHIKNLRRKIETDPATPAIVLTVLGAGYRFGLARDDSAQIGTFTN